MAPVANRFTIAETGDTVAASKRPIVIITSNSEKELPDAFLRRTVFHYIEFPDRALMTRIVGVHFPELGADLMEAALGAFYRLRGVDGLRKRPSTSELIDWIAALRRAGVEQETMVEKLPFLGVLLKHEQDLDSVLASQSRSRPRYAN